MPALLATEIRRHLPESPWTYAQLDTRQREIAALAAQGRPGAILLSEVAPVVTYGRRTPPDDLAPARLAAAGIALHATDRGGLATYHGPGQWVLFVVERLERLTGDRKGVRKGVELLLEIARRVGAQYDSSTQLREGCELGAWCARGKFAAVGIHVENGVVLHGLAINGFRTPQSFAGLRPCGLDAPVAFLLEAGGGALEIDETEELFAELGDRILTCAREVTG